MWINRPAAGGGRSPSLPLIQADLGFFGENMVLGLNVYVVAFGGLLLLGGKLSDLLALIAIPALMPVGSSLVGRRDCAGRLLRRWSAR